MRPYFLCLVLCSLISTGQGQITLASWYTGAHAIIEHEEQKLEITGPGKAVLHVQRTIKILDKAGEEAGDFVLWYDEATERPRNLFIKVWDGNNRLLRFYKQSQIEDYNLDGLGEVSDSRLIYKEVRENTFPYTVSYRYTVKSKGLLGYKSWYPLPGQGVALSAASMQIIVPSDFSFRYKTMNGMPAPQVTTTESKKYYEWELTQVPCGSREPYSPGAFPPFLLLAPNQFKMDGKEGDMTSWSSFGDFFYQLNAGREALPEAGDPILNARLAGVTDTRQKVEIIYRYMQERTRYVSIQLGIGGWQTIPATQVASSGFGDCKALTFYMKGMLAQQGIAAVPALVYGGRRVRPIQTDFPSNQFNHIILCVPIGEDTTWVECTSNDSPLGYLGAFTDDRTVLLLTEGGGILTRTPASEPGENLQLRVAHVQLAKDGAASASVQMQFTGHEQEYVRGRLLTADRRTQEGFVQEMVSAVGTEIGTIKLVADSVKPICSLSFDLSSSRWARQSGPRLFVPIHQLGSSISVPPRMEGEERTQPVKWSQPMLKVDTLVVDLPKGYVVEAMPDPLVEIIRPYGRYTSQLTATPEGQLIWIRSLKMEKCLLPAEDYNSFQQFFQAIHKAEKRQVVLSNRS